MAWIGSDGKTYADAAPDNKGTVGKSWSAAEITAQATAERQRGNYWHSTLGGVTVAAFALLSVPDRLLCLAPIP